MQSGKMFDQMKLVGPTVAGLALIAGIVAYGLYRQSSQQVEPAALRQLVEQPFPSASGSPVTISAWRGKVVLVNFWATWCAPCKEEIPLLAQMQSELGGRGLQVVGIAIDSADNVRQFLPSSAINYAVGVTGVDTLNMVRGLGDDAGALPYSVVLSRSGEVSARKLGAFHRDELQRILDRLLG